MHLERSLILRLTTLLPSPDPLGKNRDFSTLLLIYSHIFIILIRIFSVLEWTYIQLPMTDEEAALAEVAQRISRSSSASSGNLPHFFPDIFMLCNLVQSTERCANSLFSDEPTTFYLVFIFREMSPRTGNAAICQSNQFQVNPIK